jgi:hypothetical protein
MNLTKSPEVATRSGALPGILETSTILRQSCRDPSIYRFKGQLHRVTGHEYVEVTDSGHMVLLERHQLVTEHLEALTERVRRRMPPPRRTMTRVKTLLGRR